MSANTLKNMEFLHQGLEWLPESNCRGMSSEESKILFFPINTQEISYRAWDGVCSSCPVKQQCAEWGDLINGQGVFGGEYRTFDSLSTREPIDKSSTTIGGNKPGWRLLKRGTCRNGHEVISEKDIHVRKRLRNGILALEGECYICWKKKRNKTPSFQKKSGPRRERTS